MKCTICKIHEREWAWQPFGPDEDARATFTTPGRHYRGFPTIGVCDACCEDIKAGKAVTFRYRGQQYTLEAVLEAVPEAASKEGA